MATPMQDTLSSQNRTRIQNRWFYLALFGSLLLHIGLYFWFQSTRIPGLGWDIPSVNKLRPFKLERVQIDPKWMSPKLPPARRVTPVPGPHQATFHPIETRRTFSELLKTPATISPSMPSGLPQIPEEKPVATLASKGAIPNDTNRRSALDNELKSIREQEMVRTLDSAGAGRPLLPATGAPVPPRPAETGLQIPTGMKDGPTAGPEIGRSDSLPSGSGYLDSLLGPGGLPASSVDTPRMVDPSREVPQSLLEDKPAPTNKYESMSPFLTTELFTWEREGKKGNLEGYFCIRVSAKPGKELPVIPKDVFFVLDVSSSIGKNRLEAFRTMVMLALKRLNPGDRFKLVAFRGSLIPFREEWLDAAKPPESEIQQWLDRLSSGGVTDFYDGLKSLTSHPKDNKRMSLAFVMSDGLPTKGVLNSTRIISEYSDLNDGRVSIFTIGNGYDVNQFLLDFLSYCNQGRLKYSRNLDESVKLFDELVEQVRDPLFLNLRFRMAGVNGSQVYPQIPPHLYQMNPVLLFGRYEPGKTDEISVQILGESMGKTKELLAKLPIPKKPTGPDSLPATWARQSIYQTLGNITRYQQNPSAVLGMVREVGEAYGVEVPYP